jgi:phosphoribosylanthranilate isomerase
MGIQALGFVFYEPSPRCVSAQQAQRLASLLPAFVSPVLLFVNANEDHIVDVANHVPGAWLQFHGEESPEFCDEVASRLGRRWIKAIRVAAPQDAAPNGRDINRESIREEIVKYAKRYQQAHALLLDTWVAEYGGSGKSFDWSVVPPLPQSHLIVSGGLNAQNVRTAIDTLQPKVKSLAVDVSSGVERSKGIKDPALIESFVHAARAF